MDWNLLRHFFGECDILENLNMVKYNKLESWRLNVGLHSGDLNAVWIFMGRQFVYLRCFVDIKQQDKVIAKNK